MKILNNLIAWLYIILTIALGILLVISASGLYTVRWDVDFFVSQQLSTISGIWTGLALIILGSLFFYMRVKAGMSERSISFDNPEGEVTITIKAIEEFVKKVGQEFSQVIEMSPAIMPAREGIKVKIKTVLVAGTNVPRLAESIQHTIKSRMQNILGIENVSAVEINVSKLIAKGGITEETPQQTMDLG